MYIYDSPQKIKMSRQISNNIILDYDKEGNIIGIEFLGNVEIEYLDEPE